MLKLYLSDRYAEALNFAFRMHRKQLRKGSGVPYLTHLMSVSALVMEYGGGEDEAIAALLHDAIEDQNVTHQEISDRFGERVADIVQGCTHAKMDWKSIPKEDHLKVLREKRLDYFEHLKSSFPAIQLVSACDKLHNARHILQDTINGRDIFAKMRGGVEGTLWYYTNLADVFMEVGPKQVGKEISETVRRIRLALENLPPQK